MQQLCSFPLQEPHKLHISGFSTAAQAGHKDVTLSFAHALLPAVALDVSHVYALTAGGYLHSIQLPDDKQAGADAPGQHSLLHPVFTDLTAGELQLCT